MNKIQLKAYAKINLSLDVLGKRHDGYHNVCMVMQQVSLYDNVTVSTENSRTNNISVTSNLSDLPTDENNLGYRAALLLRDKYMYDNKCLITIDLDKSIPLAAGLAGGSANAAAVLHALNSLWNLKLSLSELMDIGLILGADVPFCLMGQAASFPPLNQAGSPASTCVLATGIGEILTPLPPLKAWLVLSKPPVHISTAAIYSSLLMDNIGTRPNTKLIIQGLNDKNYKLLIQGMANVLQPISESYCPEITNTINRMKALSKSRTAMMSGSGPTVFTICEDHKSAVRIYNIMKEFNKDTFLVSAE
jgi:4-diphosphocytidyl-2-C-methyl-D-erythritol kinase